MLKVTYKVYIPFHFIIGNLFYKTNLTIKEFNIGDIQVKISLDESGEADKCFFIVNTSIVEDGINDIEDIADSKVGKGIQSFFDGISKGLHNSAFFNIYNGDNFVVPYERYFEGSGSKIPARHQNSRYYIDDNLVNKAIEFANFDNSFLKQGFYFLKEGEYLADIGRYGNAIIQFSAMMEYLINYQLRKNGFIEGDGKFLKKYSYECDNQWKSLGKSGKVSFCYSRYEYGLNLIGHKIDEELLEVINDIYHLRNKLAHGYQLYEAFNECKILYNEEIVNEFNIRICMMMVAEYMGQVYQFFEDNFAVIS